MKYSKKGNKYLLRIERGEELISAILKFLEQEQVFSGLIFGIGAVQSVELGFYHLDKKEYEWKKFMTPLEIVSFSGNIALVEQTPSVHVHGVFSDSKFQTFGGHVKEAIVGATAEIILAPLDTITRTFNDEIGLKLLDCEKSN